MIDSVILSRFKGHDILPECVAVCVGGVYELEVNIITPPGMCRKTAECVIMRYNALQRL